MSIQPAPDDPRFSRTGMTGPFGKLTEDLGTKLDEKTYNQFLRRAASLEVTPSELMRELVYLYEHGITFSELCAKHRRELMQREGGFEALIGGLHG